jgi:lipoprotein-anchoring transpeptidase ErfK/SrfK
MVPKSTLLAHLLKRTAGYRTAKARHPNMHIPKYWYYHRTVLPVVAHKRSRMKVRLERRPNGSTTWIRAKAVGYSHTGKAILIDLKQRRLYWFDSGHRKGSAPVGIGAPGDPTPTGSYFIAFHSLPPSPGYGKMILATSAHSNKFQDFEGFNDAIIAIHGPLGEEAAIKPNGARVSHGCIRMLNGALDKIRHFPNGTPIIIVKG